MKNPDTTELFCFKPKKRPKGWRSRFGVYALDKDGTIFLPGELFGGDAFLCASFDGEPIVLADRKTALFRTDWLKKTIRNTAQ
jgi:hypothetical protein